MDSEERISFSWRRLEYVSLAAFAMFLACIFIGQTAERYAAALTSPEATVIAAKPTFNAVDYATTGAIKSGTVIIGPCDTKRP